MTSPAVVAHSAFAAFLRLGATLERIILCSSARPLFVVVHSDKESIRSRLSDPSKCCRADNTALSMMRAVNLELEDIASMMRSATSESRTFRSQWSRQEVWVV